MFKGSDGSPSTGVGKKDEVEEAIQALFRSWSTSRRGTSAASINVETIIGDAKAVLEFSTSPDPVEARRILSSKLKGVRCADTKPDELDRITKQSAVMRAARESIELIQPQVGFFQMSMRSMNVMIKGTPVRVVISGSFADMVEAAFGDEVEIFQGPSLGVFPAGPEHQQAIIGRLNRALSPSADSRPAEVFRTAFTTLKKISERELDPGLTKA